MEPVSRRVEETLLTTIAEVASRAGVAVATVSRVLNDSPSVSAPTRRRVLAVIEELGYEPHAAARALSTGRTGTIGVVAAFLTTPSVVERLRGVSRAVSGRGYQLVLYDVACPEQLARLPVGGRLDGLLCMSMCPSESDLARFRSAGVTVGLVDCEHAALPGVTIDDVAGGRLAAMHLLALGHRRIAFVGDDEDDRWQWVSSARRRTGAQAAVAAAGAELIVRHAPHGREEARAEAAGLLASADRPTAVFAASDQQALGVLEAAGAAGVAVPDELSVIGFDDVEVARYAGLTTVAQPLETSGEEGARLLLEAMEGAPRRATTLPLRLVRRSTTGPPGTVPENGPQLHMTPARGRRRTTRQEGLMYSA